MTSNIVRIASLLLASAVALVAVTWAQPAHPPAACSNATVIGNYGISFGGIDRHGNTTVTVDQITTDGNGSFTGHETQSKGGVILNSIPVVGTYAIKANCTGSGTWMAMGKIRHYDLVVVSGGSSLELVQTDAGRIESGLAQAQGNATCTDAGVKGTYGFNATGSIVSVGPVAFIGEFKLDGAGKIAGSESGSINGTIFKGIPLAGTYMVNSDCNGTATVTPKGQAAVNFNLVVIDAGTKTLAIETDSNTIVSGALQK